MIDTFGIDSMTIDVSGQVYVSLTEKLTGINYVFKWMGEDWAEVGGPTAANRLAGSYISRIRYKNGLLYAGVMSPPALENSIFRFVSNTWAPVGSLTNSVYEFDIASDGSIFVAAGSEIYKSTGDVWSTATPEPGSYNKIAVDQSDRVYTARLATGANGFRVYDSGLWSTLPDAPIEADDVVKMCTYGDKLYVAGWSIVTDEMIVAVYNGGAWSQLDEIVDAFPSYAGYEISALYADDKGVYITYKDKTSGSSVLKWNGLEWLSIGDNLLSSNGFGGAGYFSEFIRNNDGYLMGAGSAHNVDGVVAGNVARYLTLEDAMLLPPPIWTGLPFPNGNVHQISSMTKLGNDIYFSVSEFPGKINVGPGQNSFIYKWNNGTLTEMGGVGNRLIDANSPDTTMSVVMDLKWNNGKLYAGTLTDGLFVYDTGVWSKIPGTDGVFQMSFDITDPNIIYLPNDSLYYFDGTNYVLMPFDSGNTSYYTTVTADGKVYLSGYDISNNGIDYEYIDDGLFYWDGIAYHPLGNGVSSPIPEWNKMRYLASYGNKVYVMGEIEPTSKVGVAMWDGKEWELLGDIHSQYPDVSTILNNIHWLVSGVPYKPLYVDETGVYIFAYGASVARILRWDGLTWTDIGSPIINNGENPFSLTPALIGYFNQMVVLNGKLYGGGLVTSIQDEPVAGNLAYRTLDDTNYNIANWFGNKNPPVNYGDNGGGYECTSLNGDTLYVTLRQIAVVTSPYQDYVYKLGDHEVWEMVGNTTTNKPPFGGIRLMTWKDDILYVIGLGGVVAKYDAGLWSSLPTFLGSAQGSETLEVFNSDDIYIGGFENLWHFNLGVWTAVVNIPGYYIEPKINAAGNLFLHIRENAGSIAYFAEWDGTTLTPITNPPNVSFFDSSGFKCHTDGMYVIGYDEINNIPNVYKYDTFTWSIIGNLYSNIPDTSGKDIQSIYADDYGVYVNIINNDVGGGSFIAKWNGVSWSKIANVISSADEFFGSIEHYHRKSNGRLFVSGYFSAIDGVIAKGIGSFAINE